MVLFYILSYIITHLLQSHELHVDNCFIKDMKFVVENLYFWFWWYLYFFSLRCFCNVIFQGSTCYWLRSGVSEPPWYFKAFVWSGSHKSMDYIAFFLPYPHLIVCMIISPYITMFFFASQLKKALKGVRVATKHRHDISMRYRITGLSSAPLNDLTYLFYYILLHSIYAITSYP